MNKPDLLRAALKYLAVLLIAASTQIAGAFTYSNTDLLLIFREDGFNDVEFNIGSVSNFLGKASGTTITVNNWNFNQVRGNFNNSNSLSGVKFLLIATTSSTDSPRRSWLTDANAGGTPTDVSGSKMSTLHGKIDLVAQQAQANTVTNNVQVYIVPPADSSSYTSTASEGGTLDPATMGGSAPFPVESEIPATNRFFELKVSNLSVKPAAVQVGSFALTSAGVLTFTAGSLAPLQRPQIVANARTGNQQSVSFTTVTGGNYRLRYINTLNSSVATWTALPTVIAGNGSTRTLTDTSADAVRFYAVEAFR